MTSILTATTQQERCARYSDLIDPKLLAATCVTVIGCGAVGRRAAIDLASMGIGHLLLCDFDRVSPENMGPQGFSPLEIEMTKTAATHDQCVHVNPDCTISTLPRRWNRTDVRSNELILCCVDSLDTRRFIFTASQRDAILFSDTRMSAFSCLHFAHVKGDNPNDYLSTLTSDSDASPEPCAARSTPFCAAISASVHVLTLFQHLRGQHVSRRTVLNLLDLPIA